MRLSVEEWLLQPKSYHKRQPMSDAEIRARAEGDPDAGLDVDWSNAKVIRPRPKVAISLRLDPDVFLFFKKQGKGHLSHMAAVLRSYMEQQPSATSFRKGSTR